MAYELKRQATGQRGLRMARKCRITVGFQAANRSIKEITDEVPEEWIPKDYAEAAEVLNVPQVRRRITIAGTPLYVQISEPYEDFTLPMT